MNDKLSLTELQLVIRDSLYLSLPGFYWVTAEISDIRENYAGHCYLELVEKHPDDVNLRSKARAVIWSNRFRFIRHLFENTTGESLRQGLKILVHVKVEYHEIYGLSLVINDIDPSFTLGEMALKRQQIIRKLEEEGVLTMNRELPFPVLPKRIAVVSSKNAAGLTDFLKHLTENSFGYRFSYALFEAAMQGKETEEAVISALDRISEHLELFDVVAIVRGGGSQSDLSWFDNYNIAFHVTQFPLPVITGIGHEKDLSVTDIVAHRSEKTPTAVADFLINTMAETEEHIEELFKEISELALTFLRDADIMIDTWRMKLIPAAGLNLNYEKAKLSERTFRLINFGKGFILKESSIPVNQRSRLVIASRMLTGKHVSGMEELNTTLRKSSASYIRTKDSEIGSLMNSLNLLSPENVLKRGYTITSLNGKIILSSNLVNIGDDIETLFNDGKIGSKIVRKTGAGKSNKQ